MEQFSMPQLILQVISEKGFDGLREIIRLLFHEAIELDEKWLADGKACLKGEAGIRRIYRK